MTTGGSGRCHLHVHAVGERMRGQRGRRVEIDQPVVRHPGVCETRPYFETSGPVAGQAGPFLTCRNVPTVLRRLQGPELQTRYSRKVLDVVCRYVPASTQRGGGDHQVVGAGYIATSREFGPEAGMYASYALIERQ